MANLDAYIDFDVTLDFKNAEIRLTDTGTYPVGVNTGITGIVTITQPDGVTLAGDWNNPDITWTGTELTVAVKELRTTAQNTPQCGVYTITYEIIHPSYTPTILTRSFSLNVIYPEVEIVEDFDVFTPLLTISDETVYTLNGFDAPTINRNWSIAVGSVTTINSILTTVDLAYNGQYYDAVYTVDFTVSTIQQHSTYTYLSVEYQIPFTGTFTADTPPSVNDLVGCLTELKALVDAQADADCCSSLENKYGKAERRLSHLFHILRTGGTEGALDLLEEFLDLTACDSAINRNEPIEPYVLPDPGGSGVEYFDYTLPSDQTEVEITALSGTIIKAIDMDGIGRMFSVGLDSDIPLSGRFIVVNNTPKKFKYGGTMAQDQWLRIHYSTL
jgi:hypothetical protein